MNLQKPIVILWLLKDSESLWKENVILAGTQEET